MGRGKLIMKIIAACLAILALLVFIVLVVQGRKRESNITKEQQVSKNEESFITLADMINQGDYENAKILADELVLRADNPEDKSEAYIERASFYLSRDMVDEGMSDLDRAIAVNEKNKLSVIAFKAEFYHGKGDKHLRDQEIKKLKELLTADEYKNESRIRIWISNVESEES